MCVLSQVYVICIFVLCLVVVSVHYGLCTVVLAVSVFAICVLVFTFVHNFELDSLMCIYAVLFSIVWLHTCLLDIYVYVCKAVMCFGLSPHFNV